ncbi:hypothetical protein [Agrobacterium pusense]|uniref:hypothetical protein n=1 Tax=Agrobacterium pusense TaxID=648995 RepID=UPI002F403773
MSTTDNMRMPLVDHEFRFRIPGRIWDGCDESWVHQMTLQSRDWLYSQPHVVGTVAYEDELFVCLWRDLDRSQGVDIVYMIIANEEFIDAHRDDRKGAIAVTLSVGAGKSCYQVAEKLEETSFLRDLHEVLDIVLAQGRLRVM